MIIDNAEYVAQVRRGHTFLTTPQTDPKSSFRQLSIMADPYRGSRTVPKVSGK